MKCLAILLVLLLSLSANRCSEVEEVEQGLEGQVLWLEGNQMPQISDSPAPENRRKEPKGIRREVYIYRATLPEQAKGQGVFFSDIQTELIKTVWTDEEGFFSVALPTGLYSLFVQEEEGLFASTFGPNGHINPVEVKRDEVTSIRLEVNYKAAY